MLPRCERAAVDPLDARRLCATHLEEAESGGESTAESDEEESADAPADEDGGVGVSDAEAAFADAVAWFAAQLDHDLPEECEHETPRDYYRDGRGWSAETIDAKRLGYVPGNCRDELLAHLHDRGHGREAIVATGLFSVRDDGNLHMSWSGRYVLPYLDADGRPAFAISRATDPAHPDDWAGDNKYMKLPATRENVALSEPIYGLDTVRDGEPVLITEGIADAITAHQIGYPCISPVTTQFKDKDRAALLDVLDAQGVDRAYLVQDAERPTSELSETPEDDEPPELSISQYGDGVRGAVKTAAYLTTNDVDARVAELPRPGLDKVDLDDYLRDWSDDLRPVLASARPVDQHPAHDPETTTTAAIDAATRSGRGDDGISSHSGGSALFSLDIEDVTGLEAGYRGPNPLGHHGESENYCRVLGDDGVLYDHKYKEAYNALTYLLVEAGERRADAPNGSVADDELLSAWVHAKDRGLLPDDDPIPRGALTAVAREAADWGGEYVEHETGDGETFEGLPTSIYNDALDAVREQYDVAPGRHQSGGGGWVTAIPFDVLDVLDPEEARRYARKRGISWPSTDDARQMLKDGLFSVLREENDAVIDAPTSLGKSHTVAATPWREHDDVTGGEPVIHLSETRKARDQAIAASAGDSDVTHATLLGRDEACAVAAGDHDPVDDEEEDDALPAPDVEVTIGGTPASEWFDAVCNGRGVAFSVAHAHLTEHNDQGLPHLPCCGPPDADPDGVAECPGVTQWNGIPRTDDGEPTVDVIHATHQFAHVPSLVRETNLVFDEEPGFGQELSTDRVQRAVAAYLEAIDAPAQTWEAFVQLARSGGSGTHGDVDAERNATQDALDRTPDRDWYLEHRDAHTLAPALAKAIWFALAGDADANGRRSATVPHEPPRLDAGATDDEGWNREWVTVVLTDDNRVRTVRAAPDLSLTRTVVGLDAHPSAPVWQRNTKPTVQVETVLGPDERRLWRRFERGLLVVQMGDATRPLTSGEYFDEGGTKTAIEGLHEHYGDRFATAITANSVEGETRRLMREDGISVRGTMHYGGEKSRNDFAGEDVGFLNGCIDPGDDYVVDLLAECGLDATPAQTEDGDRAHGRGFDGPDAETAAALLASVRENHVAQSAGRYARNADDPSNSAVVFVRTDAIPPGFADLQIPGVEWVATDAQRDVLNALADHPGATAKELAEHADVSRRHANETLRRYAEQGVVGAREGAGDHGATLYRLLADEAPSGFVDLSGAESGTMPYGGSSTWSFQISQGQAPVAPPQPPRTTPTPPRDSHQRGLGAFTGPAPPPERPG